MPAKNRQKSASHKTLWLVCLIVAVLLIAIFTVLSRQGIFDSTKQPASPYVQPATTTFHASSVMGGFTIEVPAGFEVEEKNTIIILKKNNSFINIYRTGTNYASLKDIFSSDKDLKSKNINYFKINELEAGLELKQNEKTYYIYTLYELFSITTQSDYLFLDLDQIAQSFQVPEK